MRTSFALLSVSLGLALAPASASGGEPGALSFSKQFAPATIGPGSASTLTFSIGNDGPNPVTDLAFTDVLPAGVTIAAASQAFSGCEGTLDAPPGGTTISFVDGVVAGSAACSLVVDVTSATPGAHENTTSDLTSSAGATPPAVATLTVDTGRPGFSKSFDPAVVPLGGRSTLTFTIDNTANSSGAVNLTFTDPLPVGLAVAGPPDASTTCGGGVLTAAPGSGSLSYAPLFPGDATVGAGSSCTIEVDVVAVGAGANDNTTGSLTSVPQSGGILRDSGKAAASLLVSVDPLHLIKSFVDDPAAPGGSVTLRFTVLNRDRELGVTDITFTDDLDATLSGLAATPPLPTAPCGPGSTLAGTSLLTLTGGTLPPEGGCTFDVTLAVPAGAQTGAHPNTTSAVSGDLEGAPVMGGPAAELLFVAPVPRLTKEFVDDPVGAGGSVTLQFTITNPSATATATEIAFLDVFDAILPSASMVPGPGFCGPSSTAVFTAQSPAQPARLAVSGGELGPGASCTFAIVLDVVAGAAAGLYPNVTSAVTAMVDGETLSGSPASDDLMVIGAPQLTKTFTDDPADPGGTVTLEFTLSDDEAAGGNATAIAFSDDLDAALPGLTALGLPMDDVCGTGSSIDGTTELSFTGGSLTAGLSCTFAVTLQVPADAPAGIHTNTTGAVTALVAGVAVTGAPAQDDLVISGLELSKEFTDDPVVPGGTATLELSIANVSPLFAATDIALTDDLDAALTGLVAVGLPMNDVCGAGSSISGTAVLTLTGGSLGPGASCTITVTLQVPGGAAPGSYLNTTSVLTATMDGQMLVFPAAVDQLEVSTEFVAAAKSFIDDPVAPGGMVTLEFTLSNLHATEPLTAITFTDDLDAVVSGLTAVGLPVNDVCGAGSMLSGTSLLTLTGGSLPALGSCIFSVTLQVPAAVPLGTVAVNTTSAITAMLSGVAVTGAPAVDELRIDSLAFTKAFAGPTTAGGTVSLAFTIENLDDLGAVQHLAFLDDLAAVVPGLTAVGLPMSDVCGRGSTLSGTTLLSLQDGSVAPDGSCSFAVTLEVPAGAAPGSYPNTTSDLTSGGLPVAAPAVDSLVIEPPPTFGKDFSPASVPAGDPSTLTFTIDNTASALAAGGLDFTDDLPAGLVVATPANASTTCSGGTLTAVSGSGSLTYTGGTVAAGGACTVVVDVTGDTAGLYVNVTGELTSSSGNSGTATAELEILDVVPPQVTNVDSILGTDGEIAECDGVRTTVAALLVTFDEAMYDPGDPMDPNAVTNPDNWLLVGSGADRDLSTTGCGMVAGDDEAVTFETISWDGGTLTALLAAAGPGALADAPYRLFACGDGALLDTGGNELDGDGDGVGGDDFVRTFRIDRFDALENGHFDCGLDGWTSEVPPGTEVAHSTDDVDDAGVSGSAALSATSPNVAPALAQCTPILPESIYRLSGFARLNSPLARLVVARCETFAATDCSGAPLFTAEALVPLALPGVWTGFVTETPLMAGPHSALCRFTVAIANEPAFAVQLDDLSFDAVFTQVLFLDGFESGDTSAWTTTVP